MSPAVLLLTMSVGQAPYGTPAYPSPMTRVQATAPEAPPAAMAPAPMALPSAGPSTQLLTAGPEYLNAKQADEFGRAETPPDDPEPWALMRGINRTALGPWFERTGFEIYGWTQGNYTLSSVSPSNRPMGFNDRSDFWQMNQNFLRVERMVDTEKNELQIGGRTDFILPGTDARYTVSRGLLDNQNSEYPVDLFEAFIDTYLPNIGPKGTTFRFGKFATLVGYELVQAPETPFVSRSYLFLYNPFTHTGGLAITPLNDEWTMTNGFALGNDNWFGSPSRLNYIGQLAYSPTEGKTSVLLNSVITNPRYDTAGDFPFYNTYNMVVIHKFTDELTGVVDSTFSHMDTIPEAGSANWYGAAGYLIYQFSDKLAGTVRTELFEDSKGVRTGTPGLYTEVTTGLAYSLARGVIFRPSVRYDNNRNSPFSGQSDMWTGTSELIVRW